MLKLTFPIGQKFGRLKILKRVENNKWGSSQWLCQCDCGSEIIVRGCRLKSGYAKSCGCSTTKHGHYRDIEKSKIYKTWLNMIDRCTNPRNYYYCSYGGRGITVCKQWKISFDNFIRDMGQRPVGCSIERKNNNEGYSKTNCCWATPKEQARNRRSNYKITHNGETHILIVWANKVGISKDTIRMRLNRGWSISKALTTPIAGRQK